MSDFLYFLVVLYMSCRVIVTLIERLVKTVLNARSYLSTDEIPIGRSQEF